MIKIKERSEGMGVTHYFKDSESGSLHECGSLDKSSVTNSWSAVTCGSCLLRRFKCECCDQTFQTLFQRTCHYTKRHPEFDHGQVRYDK